MGYKNGFVVNRNIKGWFSNQVCEEQLLENWKNCQNSQFKKRNKIGSAWGLKLDLASELNLTETLQIL